MVKGKMHVVNVGEENDEEYFSGDNFAEHSFDYSLDPKTFK